MSNADRLLRAFEKGTLMRPAASTSNSVDLARALAALNGVDDIALTEGARRMAEQMGCAEHCVFVLVDGLGMNLVERLPRDAFLRKHLVMELRAVFPSATAAALTTLATGLWPNQHAVPGWWTYLDERAITATMLPFVERFSGRSLSDFGVRSEDAYPVRSLVARYRSEPRAYYPQPISGSVYSRYVTGGAEHVPYTSLAAAVENIIARVCQAAGRTYTYLYAPAVDALEHMLGPDSEPMRDLVLQIDHELEKLAGGLHGRGQLIVSADHGQTAVPLELSHALQKDDPLLALLVAPPTGEPRSPRFHVKPGARDEFAAQFRARFGARFNLLSTDEAEALELYGPGTMSDLARRRVGDFVAIPEGCDVLLYTGREPSGGDHGGLSPAEMRIPLVVA